MAISPVVREDGLMDGSLSPTCPKGYEQGTGADQGAADDQIAKTSLAVDIPAMRRQQSKLFFQRKGFLTP